MPKGVKATRYQKLEDAGDDALRVIHQHRLVTTSQPRALVLPERSLRRMQAVVAAMAQRGLVAAATARRPWPGQAESVWFLTRRGAAAVEEPDASEPRRRLLTPQQAAGPLQGHTLAVNEVGVAFTRAAREWGHDFDARSWRHEIAHDYRIGKRRRVVIADAVLGYLAWSKDGTPYPMHRFLEVDRGNMQVEHLVARLRRYVDLYGVWRDCQDSQDRSQDPFWPPRYQWFPRVMVVFAPSPRANPARRLTTVMRFSRETEVFRWEGWLFSYALLDQLVATGPFARVFHRMSDDQLVNWLDEPAKDTNGSPDEQGEAA
jgi:Replication-relaxation